MANSHSQPIAQQSSSLIDMLEREPTLALLVSLPPVAFQRPFVDMTGSVTAALLLSVIIDFPNTDPNGWFVCDCAEIQDQTGLTRKEQATARSVLRRKGLINERRARDFPTRLLVQIDYNQLNMRLIQVARERFGDLRNQDEILLPMLPSTTH